MRRDPAVLHRGYDLVVVGGGITGVCVLREAAARGLRALLLEQGDVGSGTSSATTKYIHGGIRYLEQYEFGVVRESLRERRRLALAAPHLVRPVRFLMPAWRWSKPPAWLLAAGVAAYDVLAFDKNHGVPPSLRMQRPSWVSRASLLRAVPWLQPDGLQGAFAYPDVLNVHPERLLLGLLGSAVQLGGAVLTHAEVTGFTTRPRADGGVDLTGVEVADRVAGTAVVVHASAVVNAAGPWMDLVLARLGRPLGVGVRRSKGVHLLTRSLGGRGRVTDAVFARAPNGHHVVVSPWMGRTFIGPTDTPLAGPPEEARPDADDVRLVLDTVNATIGPPDERLTPDDVELVTVGVRPLVVDDRDSSYTASRRHEIYDHGERGVHGLWSIGGGKWTTGRAVAEDVLDRLPVSRALGHGSPRGAASTRRLPALGAFAWAHDAAPFVEAFCRSRPEVPVDRLVREHLARLYGTGADRVLDLVADDRRLGERLSARPGVLDIAAQVVVAVADELAVNLDDIVDRRLVLGTVAVPDEGELRAVAAVAAPLRGWSADEIDRQVARYDDRRRRLRQLRQTVR
jgi:glycerol-3-phosphate dehydrogenase